MNDYKVFYDDARVGHYYVFDDEVRYSSFCRDNEGYSEDQKQLGLDTSYQGHEPLQLFADLIDAANRVPGTRRVIYQKGHVKLERTPNRTDERFSVYRRSADEGDPDYSPLPHDAPHYEGPSTPEGMREWASWYAFNKMDDGTYEAELDEAWWWGGGHNDGGTIHREIPEEWFELPYEEFLQEVVSLAAAAHYGFTAEMLLEREGLREFFGFAEQPAADAAAITIKQMETDDEIRGRAYVHWKAWHETYPGLVRQEYLDKLTLERCIELAFKWPSNNLIAVDDGRVVGFAAYGVREDETPNMGEVFALYVLSEYHGTGVGRQLMDAALEQLGAYPRVCVWTLKDNARARRFYEKCGFQPDGTEKYSTIIDAEEIRMTLER